jgi:hypothetical protein
MERKMKYAIPLSIAAQLFAVPVLAGDDFYLPVSDTLTLEECSACHMAFPVGLLPDASWNRIMDTLDNHFGEDASLSAEATAEIRAYLTGAAPASMRGVDDQNPLMRISELPWFTHEHGKRVLAKVESNPAIGSIANCAACHKGAEKGWFEDD